MCRVVVTTDAMRVLAIRPSIPRYHRAGSVSTQPPTQQHRQSVAYDCKVFVVKVLGLPQPSPSPSYKHAGCW